MITLFLKYYQVSRYDFSANSGLHVFYFLANSILNEVLLSIQKGKPGAFSPKRPTKFLKNYKTSMLFLDYLEGIFQFTLKSDFLFFLECSSTIFSIV